VARARGLAKRINTPLAIVVGNILGHRRGSQPDDIECPDQVDFDHPSKECQIVRPVFAHHARGAQDSRTADQSVNTTEGRLRR
jgi:hypothetical protein